MVVVIPFFFLIAGPPISGAIRDFCHKFPNPTCDGIDNAKRDIIDMSDVPKLNVERAAVGPCNIPMYNFDLCRDQVKSQTIQVVSSIPSPGGKCSHPTMAMASYIERVKWIMEN